MTRLMQELLKDPKAVFEVNADLPSGNRMLGTVGPIIGDRLHSAITFTISPASEDDVAIAKQCLDQALGMTSEVALVSNTNGEREKNLAVMRKFMGGGQG